MDCCFLFCKKANVLLIQRCAELDQQTLGYLSNKLTTILSNEIKNLALKMFLISIFSLIFQVFIPQQYSILKKDL